ncbi:MAG: glycosyltransferase family 4 protein [Flavobacteriaceae bacterium]|nr:glycosyltransferase family 4 protein [Flavobacteriaceae bacterium]
MRGAELFTCQLSQHLSQLGHQVLLVKVFKGVAVLPFNGSIVSLGGNKKRRWVDVIAWYRLSILIKTFQPDLIQTNAGDTLKYAVISKWLFGWKTPIIVRNASMVGRYLTTAIHLKINAFFYKKAIYVIAVSKASEKDLLQHFPFLKAYTTVIPVGIEEVNCVKMELDPPKRKHILHVGGFTYEKNHIGLLRIFKRVLEVHKEAHLHLLGDGPLLKNTKQCAKEWGIDKHCTFYGAVSNPISYMKAADVVVLPSIIEGIPAVLLEAMYAKTPVVTYEVGGIAEVLVNQQTGYLIPSGDENAFAETIGNLLTNPDSNLPENAYQQVCQQFANTKIAQRFEAIYKQLLNEQN